MYSILMSPTLFRIGGIRVIIYTKEHKPAHVHLVAPNAEAKIELKTWRIVQCRGFSEKALNRIMGFLRTHEQELMEAWNEIHE